jgi:hypothetical protein
MEHIHLGLKVVEEVILELIGILVLRLLHLLEKM